MRKGIVYTLLLFFVLCITEYSYSEEPKSGEMNKSVEKNSSVQKNGMGLYVGGGLGYGLGDYTIKNGDTIKLKDAFGNEFDNNTTTPDFNVHAGLLLIPGFRLGIDVSMTGVEGEYSDSTTGYKNSSRIYISNFLVAASYFPFDEGLFFKGGAGLANYDYKSEVHNPSAIVVDTINTESYFGQAFLVGAGYYYQFNEMFSLGIHGDFSYQRYNKDIESSKFWSIYISFEWLNYNL
jgi:hypothetical protein